ncbi:MAG: hypothetical protein ACXWNZ_18020, partial [Vulcanimicrobiaceae bacterium]
GRDDDFHWPLAAVAAVEQQMRRRKEPTTVILTRRYQTVIFSSGAANSQLARKITACGPSLNSSYDVETGTVAILNVTALVCE